MGQEMGNVANISRRTGAANMAPISRPCFEHKACGMISPNKSTAVTDMAMATLSETIRFSATGRV